MSGFSCFSGSVGQSSQVIGGQAQEGLGHNVEGKRWARILAGYYSPT